MSRLVFDIEANGFLDDVTKVHIIVTKDIDTHEVKKYYDTLGGADGTLLEGVEALCTADSTIIHNGIGYDFPVIEKLYDRKPNGEIIDTLVMSRLLYPDRPIPYGCSGGGHSIEAWGRRLKRYKPCHEDWSVLTYDMIHRCAEDVEIGYLTYLALLEEMNNG
jgi:hypothetical protein